MENRLTHDSRASRHIDLKNRQIVCDLLKEIRMNLRRIELKNGIHYDENKSKSHFAILRRKTKCYQNKHFVETFPVIRPRSADRVASRVLCNTTVQTRNLKAMHKDWLNARSENINLLESCVSPAQDRNAMKSVTDLATSDLDEDNIVEEVKPIALDSITATTSSYESCIDSNRSGSNSEADEQLYNSIIPNWINDYRLYAYDYFRESTIEAFTSVPIMNNQMQECSVDKFWTSLDDVTYMMEGTNVNCMFVCYDKLTGAPWLLERVNKDEFDVIKEERAKLAKKVVDGASSSRESLAYPYPYMAGDELPEYFPNFKQIYTDFWGSSSNERRGVTTEQSSTNAYSQGKLTLNGNVFQLAGPIRYDRGNDFFKNIQLNAMYAMLGSDGQLLWINPYKENFHLSLEAKQLLSRSEAFILLRLASLGYYVNQLRALSALHTQPPLAEFGQIGRALSYALADELLSYYRLFHFYMQDILTEAKRQEFAFKERNVSLGKLHLWQREQLLIYRFLTHITRKSLELYSVQPLVVTLYSFRGNGIHDLENVLNRLLDAVFRPYYRMIVNWLQCGIISDAYKDFFVIEHTEISDNFTWQSRFSICPQKIPPFLDYEQTQRIFTAGKSKFYFLYIAGERPKQFAWNRQAETELTNCVKHLLRTHDSGPLSAYIDRHYNQSTQELFEHFPTPLQFLDHLQVLKKYVMLSDKLFVGVFIDLLELPMVNNEYAISMELNARLQNAMQLTATTELSDELFYRLKLEMSPTNEGDELQMDWESVKIEYILDDNLKILLSTALPSYAQFYRHMWRIHCIDNIIFKHILRNQWQIHRLTLVEHRVVTAIQKFEYINFQIQHFMTTFRYYIIYCVIETAWKAMCKRIKTAKYIDDLLAAHGEYLKAIRQGIFLSRNARQAKFHLHEVFQRILDFRNLQETFIKFCLKEHQTIRFNATISVINESLDSIQLDLEDMINDLLLALSCENQSNWLVFIDLIDFSDYYKRNKRVSQRRKWQWTGENKN